MLELSVGMFSLVGALWVFVGSLAYPLHRRGAATQYLFVSARADEQFFGGPPSQVVGSSPALDKFRTMLIAVFSGCLMLAGTTFIFLAWFGLRSGELWALVALAVGAVVAIALWTVALLPYGKAGVRLTLADVPPFIWVPAILVVPATVLGLIGISR